MAKYLKKFETTAQYDAAKSGLILPNVSLITENNKVEYNPLTPTPPTPSHDFVEIGGIKWATMNVGATGITDGGLYFQWGDTQGYTAAQVETDKDFYWEDYKYCNGTSDPGNTGMTKYNSTDGKTVLDASDDAVTAAWGGNWRMPTITEIESLFDNVAIEWTDDYLDSGIEGYILTDNTDNSKKIFFPGVGTVVGHSVNDGSVYIWSSSLANYSVQVARCLRIDNDVEGSYDDYRYSGIPVRGVLDE